MAPPGRYHWVRSVQSAIVGVGLPRLRSDIDVRGPRFETIQRKIDRMPTVLITGANRGLGLEHVRQYGEKGWTILACCRAPGEAIALNALASRNPDINVVELDVTDFSAIEKLACDLVDTPIDVLLNNAGYYGGTLQQGMPRQKFGTMDYDLWREIMEINLLASFKMCEAFIEHVAISSQKKIVLIGSGLGSIENNNNGQSYAYRTAKVGLSMLTKGLAADLKERGVIVVILAPGWCKTDLGGGDIAEVEPIDSVKGQHDVLAEIGMEQSGQWFDYNGATVPW